MSSQRTFPAALVPPFAAAAVTRRSRGGAHGVALHNDVPRGAPVCTLARRSAVAHACGVPARMLPPFHAQQCSQQRSISSSLLQSSVDSQLYSPPRRTRSRRTAAAPCASQQRSGHEHYNGCFSLILLNVVLFALDHVLHVPFVSQSLYLHHAHPHWWQFLSSAFCHANFDHLSSNLFMLLVFGKTVEQEEGWLGVWASYLFCGAGASVASYLLLPATSGGGLLGGAASVVSLGASGAVFGTFSCESNNDAAEARMTDA